jgi:hypothetical protein
MTNWQWKIILALIRFTLASRSRYEYKQETWDMDYNLLRGALEREGEKTF